MRSKRIMNIEPLRVVRGMAPDWAVERTRLSADQKTCLGAILMLNGSKSVAA